MYERTKKKPDVTRRLGLPLNYPGIDWEAGRSDTKGRAFHNACSDTFLEQQVSESTHVNENRLDLVLTNQKIIVIKIENGMEAR